MLVCQLIPLVLVFCQHCNWILCFILFLSDLANGCDNILLSLPEILENLPKAIIGK